MKLIGNLKKKVENAKTKEETKDIIAEAGMELTDDELEKVSGGDDGPLPCIPSDNMVIRYQTRT